MCDTIVVVTKDTVFFAKNSDREPGEAQQVEHIPRARPPSRRLRATHATIDQVPQTHEVVLSRPAWMWGAEMGANEHGLVIGNEAVFTKVPVASTGLLGMDLVRLALEREKTADDALELIAWLLARHGQGGAAGFRNHAFRYHNAFLIADPRNAWLLETAGPYWVAERVEGVRTISNVLSIGAAPTRVGPGTVDYAHARGWIRRGKDFDFREAFANPAMALLAAGDYRRTCTLAQVTRHAPSVEGLARALRDHAGHTPHEGLRPITPCAHASWLPTRGAGQTTASMFSRLSADGVQQHYFTGTSSPCLSVFKPVVLGGDDRFDTGPAAPTSGADDESLWWRHERLHRAVLRDYGARSASGADARASLEARALATTDRDEAQNLWQEHRECVVAWTADAGRTRPRRAPRVFDLFWRLQSFRDGISPIPGGPR